MIRKTKFGNRIAFVSICASLLTILILRGYANGIFTLSVSQHRASTNAIESLTTNLSRTCSNVPASKPFARTELFLGLSKSNGTEVNNAEFQRFLDREVTPRFPDGFTLLSGNGQFKNERGAILKERTHLLILLHPVAATDNQKIEQIRKAYITTFQQQSVLRTDQLSCASF